MKQIFISDDIWDNCEDFFILRCVGYRICNNFAVLPLSTLIWAVQHKVELRGKFVCKKCQEWAKKIEGGAK